MSIPQRLSLEQFERHVYRREQEPAISMLLDILDRLEHGGTILQGGTEAEEDLPVARLASAVTSLIADPSFRLSPSTYETLALHNRNVAALFGASHFDHSGHLMPLIATPTGRGDITFDNPQQFMKLFATATINGLSPHVLTALSQLAPEVSFPAILGLLSNAVVLTETGESIRGTLLEHAGPILERAELTDLGLARLSTVWMYTTYASCEKKHAIKRHLNEILRKWMKRKGISLDEPPAASRETRRDANKPRLLVAAERLRSNHAIYRLFASSLRPLRRAFHTVLLAQSEECDETAKALFDEVIAFKFEPSQIKAFVERVKSARPDILFFPSLGMSHWTICLANLRLAPLQVMSFGHPATSMSDFIDYVLVEEELLANPRLYREKIVHLREGAFAFVRLEHAAPPPHHDGLHTSEEVHVAVPANAVKLNSNFLSVCREIANRSKTPVRFHFFPSELGITHRYLRKLLRKSLPASDVHARSSQAEYLAALGRCDFAVGTFPFGGGNSTIDVLSLALPCVTLQGEDVPARTEAWLMRRAQLPDWTIASTKEEYVRAALRLIAEPGERQALAQHLRSVPLAETLFEGGKQSRETELVETMEWLHRSHDRIRGSDQQVWTPSDRAG